MPYLHYCIEVQIGLLNRQRPALVDLAFEPDGGPDECDGTWNTCCVDGEIGQCCCPEGAMAADDDDDEELEVELDAPAPAPALGHKMNK